MSFIKRHPFLDSWFEIFIDKKAYIGLSLKFLWNQFIWMPKIVPLSKERGK
jgi:hypothetical protein